MKLIRTEYPRVRQYVKSGNLYFAVDLRRKNHQGRKFKNFTKRQDALDYASKIGEQVSLKGIQSIAESDPRIKGWQEQCAIYNHTLDDAVALALEHWDAEQRQKTIPLIPQLCEKWIHDKLHDTLKPLRPRTLDSIQTAGNKFARDFATAKITDLQREDVELYLNKMETSNQYKKNIKNYLGQFYNWCIRKGYCEKNPCENIVIGVVHDEVGFYTVEQVKTMLDICKRDENKHMLPYFVLGLFGGIRPAEIERMDWSNIHLEGKYIQLPITMTKTKKSRTFDMTDTLFKWLDYCKDIKPLIPEKRDPKRIRKEISDTFGFPWLDDGLRHTFATYYYAQPKDKGGKSLDVLRSIMGNTIGIAERFYRGSIPQAETDAYWNMIP